MVGTCTGPLRKDLTVLGLMQIWPRRAVMLKHRGMGFEASRLNSQYPCKPPLAHVSAHMLRDGGGDRCPLVFLSPERQCHTSQTLSKKYKQSLPRPFRPSSDCTVCPSVVSLCPLGSRTMSSGLYPSHTKGPRILQCLNLTSCRNSWKSALLVFPVNGFGDSVLLVCIPVCSTLVLHDQCSLPSTAPPIWFSPTPQTTSLHFLPSLVWFLLSLVVQFILSVLRSFSWVFRIIW